MGEVENGEDHSKEAIDLAKLDKTGLALQLRASFPAEIDSLGAQFLEERPQHFEPRESRRFHPKHPILAPAGEGDKTKTDDTAPKSFRGGSNRGLHQNSRVLTED